MTTKPTLQRMLEKTLKFEVKIKHIQESMRENNFTSVNKKRRKHHHSNKMTGINKHCSIITININGFNLPVKKYKQTKPKTHLFVASKKCPS